MRMLWILFRGIYSNKYFGCYIGFYVIFLVFLLFYVIVYVDFIFWEVIVVLLV